MEDSNLQILIISIVAAIVIGIGIYFLLRFLRGTIKLQLPLTAFSPGEEVKGSFELHVKKPIQGKRLLVSLIGTQHTRTTRNGKTETHSQEVFRKEDVIEKERDYRAGFRETYNFTLAIPKGSSEEEMLQGVANTLMMAANIARRSRTDVRWKLEARLQAKGIDLVGSKKVSVNY
jgi:hypothetical protein